MWLKQILAVTGTIKLKTCAFAYLINKTAGDDKKDEEARRHLNYELKRNLSQAYKPASY